MGSPCLGIREPVVTCSKVEDNLYPDTSVFENAQKTFSGKFWVPWERSLWERRTLTPLVSGNPKNPRIYSDISQNKRQNIPKHYSLFENVQQSNAYVILRNGILTLPRYRKEMKEEYYASCKNIIFNR
jgi:hypothetical protein